MSQNEKVLDYIKANGSIDPLRAFTDLGILRLGARIWELKHEAGIDIKTEMRYKYDRNGKIEKKWAEYWI